MFLFLGCYAWVSKDSSPLTFPKTLLLEFDMEGFFAFLLSDLCAVGVETTISPQTVVEVGTTAVVVCSIS